MKTAFRNWKEFILNDFDDERVTNAFTESFNSKIRRVYRNGRGYTFERLRAKVLFNDMLQKRVPIQEKVRVKKKQKFEEAVVCQQCAPMTKAAKDAIVTDEDEFEPQQQTKVRSTHKG